ncbi:MAG: response regulator [Syntrophaceae bacterium]|nr:response regulator [Syntrophaceae bacterium]
MARILVVDDEPEVLLLLSDILESGGYEVVKATNGVEGLREYQKGGVDLIVTDIIMPDKEGLESIMDYKQINPEVKIIAISGGARIGPHTYLKMAEKFGARKVFSKPFRNKELLDAIEELLKEQ